MTVGGCRSGREWKPWTSLGLPGWIVSGVVLIGSWWAIANRSSSGWTPAADAHLRAHRDRLAFGERAWPARSSRRRPASRRAGVPLCAPVREPTTLTALSSPAGTPRKLICVCGVASRLPGSGETVTAPSSSAGVVQRARRAGRGRSAARERLRASQPKRQQRSSGRRSGHAAEAMRADEDKRIDKRIDGVPSSRAG